MSLSPGARLGSYEIVASLGVGGMGEVYRAHDTKLARDVAIKILPDAFVSDPERIARFQREAQLLAALNHPNIAAIYGLEESGGTRFLVLELVDGESIAQRLSHAPAEAGGHKRIPVAEALAIARQIVDALEAAHEKGIIHRDLKPANIMLTADGVVKVLDFGLAKFSEASGAGGTARAGEAGRPGGAGRDDFSQSPTITTPAMTQAGMILGTAAYMSPEQAKGRQADKRSDVWAFGCVLYEMFTGRRAFDGEDISDTLAAILRGEPDWSALPADVTPPIRTLLKRCVERDRKTRIPDISVVRFLMDDAGAATAPAVATPATSARARSWLGWTAAAVFLLTTMALAGWTYFGRAPADVRTMRFFIGPPDGWSLEVTGGGPSSAVPAPLAVSPDGRRVAIVARSADGRVRIWIRSLDTLTAQELAGTDAASSPFWSPDSRFLGFFADGKLKKIDVSGGPPITLCDTPDHRGGAWSRDGVIVFSPALNGAGLRKVSASGGVAAAATQLGKDESGHIRPAFLPDGRHFVYRVTNGGIYIASLDSTDRTLLFKNPDFSNPLYTQGHLIFPRERTLMAQPFDVRRLALAGEPVPIAEQILTLGGPPLGIFSVSENGVLVYQTGAAGRGSQISWLDRTGKPAATVGDRAPYADLELSPDQKRAAVSLLDPSQPTRDIWLIDLTRGLRTRFTFDPADDFSSIWSPDGSRIVFNSRRKGHLDLFQKASSMAGDEEVLLADSLDKVPSSWSSDGRFILYLTTGGPTGNDVWVLPLSGDRKPFPFLQTRFSEGPGRLSPDGRWIAYQSNESGRFEVYVAPFPGPGGKRLVSTGGGTVPRWRRDGKEIFYVSPDLKLMAAAVNAQGASFDVGVVTPLFTVTSAGGRYFYDVSPDGQRFLVNSATVAASTPSPITVVVNWTEGLRK